MPFLGISFLKCWIECTYVAINQHRNASSGKASEKLKYTVTQIADNFASVDDMKPYGVCGRSSTRL